MTIEQHISLGFSCQTRNTFSTFSAEHRRMPFDWCITTRSFVLDALVEGDGSIFMPNLGDLLVYTTPVEQAQGLYSDRGVWFWHDFPRKPGFNQLADNPLEGSRLHEKYRALWGRFLERIRDPRTLKRFVISNSQYNLELFTQVGAGPWDFYRDYGLDFEYLTKLDEALQRLGARNFTIQFMIRNIENYLDFLRNPVVGHFTPIFVGPLKLPYHKTVNTLLGQTPAPGETADVSQLIGRYDNGVELVPGPYGDALAMDANGTVRGVAREVAGGYVFCFTGGLDKVVTAVVEDGSLYFSDKGRWWRQGLNPTERVGTS